MRHVTQPAHEEGVGISPFDRGEDVPAVKRRHRHADEVHEVVPREGEGKREGARKNDVGEDVEAEKENQRLEEERAADEGNDEDRLGVSVDPLDPFGTHEGSALGALHDEEVEDRRKRDAREDAAQPPVDALVAEGEDEAKNPLHDDARNEGDEDGGEDREDHREGFARIEVSAEIGEGSARLPHFEAGHRDGATQEFKDDGDGGGGGKTEGVEGVEEENVRHHDGREYDDDFLEGEVFRDQDPGFGHLHHARRKGGAEENACAGHRQNHPEWGGLGADGGIEEVHGVVRDADEKVANGKNA